jgi:hypothetical protein
MPSVGARCPACKMPVADHLPASRYPPADVPLGKVAVVNGRCIVAGERARQKCCWVVLREPMTVAEYRERFEAGTIPLEACPCCAGRLVSWGSFGRTLAEGEPLALQGLRLLRGLCPKVDCPVCTVTHYPCFLTPYHVVPTAQRESAVRAHVEEGLSWSAARERLPWVVGTVQRWERGLAVRAGEVTTGMLGVWQRLDQQAPAELRPGQTRRDLLRAMFRVCDAVRDLLRRHEGWAAPVPGLAVPRMFRPPAPTTLPVWT